jgi:hypothetical protein
MIYPECTMDHLCRCPNCTGETGAAAAEAAAPAELQVEYRYDALAGAFRATVWFNGVLQGTFKAPTRRELQRTVRGYLGGAAYNSRWVEGNEQERLASKTDEDMRRNGTETVSKEKAITPGDLSRMEARVRKAEQKLYLLDAQLSWMRARFAEQAEMRAAMKSARDRAKALAAQAHSDKMQKAYEHRSQAAIKSAAYRQRKHMEQKVPVVQGGAVQWVPRGAVLNRLERGEENDGNL